MRFTSHGNTGTLKMAAALALLLAAAGCSGPAAEMADPTDAGKPVVVAPVVRQDMDRTVTYAADLQPWAEVQVYSRLADRVLSLPFHDGDMVQQGQRLALIKRDTLDKGIEQVAAQLEALDVQIRTQTADLERSREMLAGGVITQQLFDQAQAGLDANRAQRRALQASLDQIGLNAGDAVVLAPIAGVVANLSLDVGDQASPQLPICTVMAIDSLRVDLDMNELDAMQVSAGDLVNIQVEARPGEVFQGQVTRVYPYLEAATRTNTVEVRLDNPRDDSGAFKLKPGMFGRAVLMVDHRDLAVVAPEQALVLDPLLLAQAEAGQDLRKAFVVDEQGMARERRVHLGIRSGALYEARSGLQEGDRLVIRGQHGLEDGEAVRVVSADVEDPS